MVVLPFLEVINLNGCWGRGNSWSKDSQSVGRSMVLLVDIASVHLQISASSCKDNISCLCEGSHKFIGNGWETVALRGQN